ncbi:hypothetical protein C0995_014315 [Termitomyces sp. Mi166|nr:hypothetical protein C0995_014315 [Termitomyces sp. Mi166\
MSVATPTLLPRQSRFPHLLPKPPQPHPIPLSNRRVYGNLNAVRDLQREMEDLSDEENELEDIVRVKFSSHQTDIEVPAESEYTQQRADEDSEESGSGRSGGAPSIAEDDGENDSAPDLDASMEDLDEDGGVETDENDEMIEGETEEFEEPSES